MKIIFIDKTDTVSIPLIRQTGEKEVLLRVLTICRVIEQDDTRISKRSRCLGIDKDPFFASSFSRRNIRQPVRKLMASLISFVSLKLGAESCRCAGEN